MSAAASSRYSLSVLILERGQVFAQSCRKRLVERHERLVEQKQIGLDREGARQRHPPGESERKLAGVVIAMGLEAERLEQRVEPGGGRVRGGKPHVLLDRPPRQQARLLEDHAERAVRGERDAAVEIAVEPRDDAQQRGLAAARRPNQRGDLPTAEAECKLAEHLELPAGGSLKRLLLDVDVKPVSGASGRHVVQTAAPGTFRLPA